MALKQVKPQAWQVESFTDFVEFLSRQASAQIVVFRGQREDWPLLPRVGRLSFAGGQSLLEHEAEMFAAFKKEALTLIPTAPTNDWDWLALAQHHRLPTRLLDWTRNPLAALWFAVREAPTQKGRPGAVWMFQPQARDIIGDADTATSPFEGQRTKVYIPGHLSARIRAQDGAFTVHKWTEGKGFIHLENMSVYRPSLVKVIVPPVAFAQMRFLLDRCGIHDGSLFPDLDGLSQKIEWKHILMADEV